MYAQSIHFHDLSNHFTSSSFRRTVVLILQFILFASNLFPLTLNILICTSLTSVQGLPSVSSLKFNSSLMMAVGTSTGQVQFTCCEYLTFIYCVHGEIKGGRGRGETYLKCSIWFTPSFTSKTFDYYSRINA